MVSDKSLAVPTFLRAHIDPITRRYEQVVTTELVDLRRLPRGALIDHLPEFVEALASWIEAEIASRHHEQPLMTLAEGHALTRLGYSVSLETLTHEYVLLRKVILEELLAIPIDEFVRSQINALDLGMDHAVMLSVRRYTAQRDELRERFIAILGHDLRGPLNAIAMGAQMLLERDDLDASVIKTGSRIKRGVRRMDRMIRDVLDFARGHLGGGIPCSPSRHHLGSLCAAAVDEILAANPDREVRIETSGQLEGHWDGDRVTQSIGNLLSNAIAHGRDPIVVRVWDEGSSVVTSVTSGGDPIPADLIPHLFEPFRGNRRSAGLGLGLYITQQIALAHGGTITVASQAGATTFTIRWPRVPPEQTPSR